MLVDIPDDLQRAMIDPADLVHFTPPAVEADAAPSSRIDEVLALIDAAQRPVLVLGYGVRAGGAVEDARRLIDRLGMPFATSWAAKDMAPGSHPLNIGTFGTHGVRAGNFAVQNADLVLSIGARLSTHETGTPLTSFAREARTVVVDIDPSELGKFAAFGKPLDMAIESDAKAFIAALDSRLDGRRPLDIAPWLGRIDGWRRRYPPVRLDPQAATVDPYALMAALAEAMPQGEAVIVDTGCAVAWMMQALPVEKQQRLFHDFNNTAMGWALPAAMGAALALGKPVTCVVGDGSMMMNLQELATVVRHNLPVRLFVLNNSGYAMVQQTQEQWLGSRHIGTSLQGGLGFPDFTAVAAAFGMAALTVSSHAEVEAVLMSAYRHQGPILVDVRIPSTERVKPQCRFGYPIEDAEPLLPRAEFLANMIAAPMPKSLEPLP